MAWHDLGPFDALKDTPLRELSVGKTKFALSWKDGRFGAVSGVCNHAGGPLGEGRLDGDYIVCPWHYLKFNRMSGEGEPGFEEDRVPRHELREEGGHLGIALELAATPAAAPMSRGGRKAHKPAEPEP